MLDRYLQKVEYLLVSELSIHHRTWSHNLSFTVGRLHIKLFLKLLNIHLLPHWHYFKLFTKKPAALFSYGHWLSTVRQCMFKVIRNNMVGRSSAYLSKLPPPPKKAIYPRSIFSRSSVWAKWRPTDSRQNVARQSIQRLAQLNKSDNDADKIKTWPDRHKICRPTKKVVIGKPKIDALPTVACVISFFVQKPVGRWLFFKMWRVLSVAGTSKISDFI